MENNELRELLHQVDEEIKNTHTIDEKGSKILLDLENPISVHPSIIQRFEEALRYFEVTHPKLTIVIAKLLESLSNAGV